MADIRASVDIDEACFQTVVKVVQKTMSVLRESAEACIPRKKYSKRTVSLNVWNDDISASLRRNKVAYKAWKVAGKPRDLQDLSLLIAKKESRLFYRQAVRKELARRNNERKDQIMSANSSDKKLLFKLIGKQRQSGNFFVDDLHVGCSILGHWQIQLMTIIMTLISLTCVKKTII